MTIKDPSTDSVVIVLGMNKDNKNNYLLGWQNFELLRSLSTRWTNRNKL